MEEIKGEVGSHSDRASPSSSPPTPPSPLPVSVGPGNQKYFFSPSPSSSPPFSSHASAENLPLLQEKPGEEPAQAPSAFSLDRPEYDQLDKKSTCIKDLFKPGSWTPKSRPSTPPFKTNSDTKARMVHTEMLQLLFYNQMGQPVDET